MYSHEHWHGGRPSGQSAIALCAGRGLVPRDSGVRPARAPGEPQSSSKGPSREGPVLTHSCSRTATMRKHRVVSGRVVAGVLFTLAFGLAVGLLLLHTKDVSGIPVSGPLPPNPIS